MDPFEKTISQLPTTPGVYIYSDVDNTVIYVGKAVNLHKRVKQYTEDPKTLTPKTRQLVAAVHAIRWMQTVSEFDALLLEAELIRKHQPKYNILAKDDKSPIYIAIDETNDLPILRLVRKSDMPKKGTNFGPFQSTRMAKSILRTIRHIIPYCTQRQVTGKPCFYTHIGLCAPCPSEIDGCTDSRKKVLLRKLYRQNIKRIQLILQGHIPTVMKQLDKTMHNYAKDEFFEHAAVLRNQIQNLQALRQLHYDPSVYMADAKVIGEFVERELNDLRKTVQDVYPDIGMLHRIECYDISNTQSNAPVGSMVVLIDGQVDSGKYRRFGIKTVASQNDPAMLAEILSRRMKHTEWPSPDLIVVDGGTTQFKSAKRVLHEVNVHIPIIGLSKGLESIVAEKDGSIKIIQLAQTRPAIHILQRIRDEAHRFAITYHRKKRAALFLQA